MSGILSDLTVHMKSAKYLREENRRETFGEVVDRNKEMHLKKFPQITKEIEDAYLGVYGKNYLPSLRSFQFAGLPIEMNPARIYNCAFMKANVKEVFSETMFLLLGGTGVGYSVQKQHVEQLPAVYSKKDSPSQRYLIADSIEGWADAIKILMKSYFNPKSPAIVFDDRDIREKGSELLKSGGKAPGPEPLMDCIEKIRNLLDNYIEESLRLPITRLSDGIKLEPINVHDILCYIADAVLAGGIRRAALIALFSPDDEEMINCKSGEWWKDNPQRARANNSAVLLRHSTRRADFIDLWYKIKDSGSGDPGFYFTNSLDWGVNPCCEIALQDCQFCNLVEINLSNLKSPEDFFKRVKNASFIATLQASYTDFHYLRPKWKRITDKEALIGVSFTGIASYEYFPYNLKTAAKIVIEENERVANIIGINPAARTTCVKPAGTTSLVMGTSSGIHAWHSPYYIRRMRINKTEPIYSYLIEKNPSLVADDVTNPKMAALIEIPVKAPKGSVFRNESLESMLDRIKKFSKEWVHSGHVSGKNTNNVSATVYIKDDEWDKAWRLIWDGREYYNGLAVFPFYGGTHVQTPFEEITKEEYRDRMSKINYIDLSEVSEYEDNTSLTSELACAGGACEI